MIFQRFMTQVSKIYLSSFLKNQTYFVPIMILFFQDLGLNFQEIFWVFTAGAVFSFLIEIPTGVFADLYGRRQSIIISKLIIFLSFLAFGAAFNFWGLLLANLIYELGKSFRSGAETAYVFDYLAEHPQAPRYAKVKASQKFYGRLSESASAAAGGLAAVAFGFNAVFFLAALPAFINFAQALTWTKIKENSDQPSLERSLFLASNALRELFKSKILRLIVANIVIFSTSFFALEKFVQPYMTGAGIPLIWFGFIYSGFLLAVAILARQAVAFEERVGGLRLMNWLTLASVPPLLVLGLGLSSWPGVALFFFVLLVHNVRSPIENSVFHEAVASRHRATMGSVLELSKTAGKLLVLPAVGYLADVFSMATAILALSIAVSLNGTLLWLRMRE